MGFESTLGGRPADGARTGSSAPYSDVNNTFRRPPDRGGNRPAHSFPSPNRPGNPAGGYGDRYHGRGSPQRGPSYSPKHQPRQGRDSRMSPARNQNWNDYGASGGGQEAYASSYSSGRSRQNSFEGGQGGSRYPRQGGGKPQPRRPYGHGRNYAPPSAPRGYPDSGASSSTSSMRRSEEDGASVTSDFETEFSTVNFDSPSHIPGSDENSSSPTQTIVVDVHGEGEYRTIHEAIRAWTPGAEILVQPGIYRETLRIGPEHSGIVIRGVAENIHPEEYFTEARRDQEMLDRELSAAMKVISAGDGRVPLRPDLSESMEQGDDFRPSDGVDIEDDLNTYFDSVLIVSTHNVVVHWSANRGILKNLTIKQCGFIPERKFRGSAVNVFGGQCTMITCNVTSDRDQCILAQNGGVLHGRRCLISHSGNNGLYIRADSQIILEDCEITANKKHGIWAKSGSKIVLKGCRVHHNRKYGISFEGTVHGAVTGSVIYKNGRSGVALWGTERRVKITDCNIKENLVSGIELWHNSVAYIAHNDISLHLAANVVVCEQSRPVLEHNRIYGSVNASGILYASGGTGDFRRNSVFENRYSGIEVQTYANANILENEVYKNGRNGIHVHSHSVVYAKLNDIFQNKMENVCIENFGRAQFHRNFLSESTGSMGIVINGSHGVLLNENYIYGNARDGIVIANCTSATTNPSGGVVPINPQVATDPTSSLHFKPNGEERSSISSTASGSAAPEFMDGEIYDSNAIVISGNIVCLNKGSFGILLGRYGVNISVANNEVYANSNHGIGVGMRVNAIIAGNSVHHHRDGAGIFVIGSAASDMGPPHASGNVSLIANNNVYVNGLAGILAFRQCSPRCRHNTLHHQTHGPGLLLLNGAKGEYDSNDIYCNFQCQVEIRGAQSSPILKSNHIHTYTETSGHGSAEGGSLKHPHPKPPVGWLLSHSDNDEDDGLDAAEKFQKALKDAETPPSAPPSDFGVMITDFGSAVLDSNYIFNHEAAGVLVTDETQTTEQGDQFLSFLHNDIEDIRGYGVCIIDAPRPQMLISGNRTYECGRGATGIFDKGSDSAEHASEWNETLRASIRSYGDECQKYRQQLLVSVFDSETVPLPPSSSGMQGASTVPRPTRPRSSSEQRGAQAPPAMVRPRVYSGISAHAPVFHPSNVAPFVPATAAAPSAVAETSPMMLPLGSRQSPQPFTAANAASPGFAPMQSVPVDPLNCVRQLLNIRYSGQPGMSTDGAPASTAAVGNAPAGYAVYQQGGRPARPQWESRGAASDADNSATPSSSSVSSSDRKLPRPSTSRLLATLNAPSPTERSAPSAANPQPSAANASSIPPPSVTIPPPSASGPPMAAAFPSTDEAVPCDPISSASSSKSVSVRRSPFETWLTPPTDQGVAKEGVRTASGWGQALSSRQTRDDGSYSYF